MVERIRTLLDSRQLTPTQFADVIGVARPIISHILSGRNKPSLEVVQRILAAMPDLSMPWLLNGTGPMLATVTPAALAAAIATPSQAPVATKAVASTAAIDAEPHISGLRRPAPIAVTPPVAQVSEAKRPVPRRFISSASKAVSADKVMPSELSAHSEPETPANAPVVSDVIGQNMAVSPESNDSIAAAPQEPMAMPDAPQATNATAAALFAGTEKPIRRIVIFYRDGSFADYQPE
jgi:transcriptional regulator with XRE-family HTH domain